MFLMGTLTRKMWLGWRRNLMAMEIELQKSGKAQGTLVIGSDYAEKIFAAYFTWWSSVKSWMRLTQSTISLGQEAFFSKNSHGTLIIYQHSVGTNGSVSKWRTPFLREKKKGLSAMGVGQRLECWSNRRSEWLWECLIVVDDSEGCKWCEWLLINWKGRVPDWLLGSRNRGCCSR